MSNSIKNINIGTLIINNKGDDKNDYTEWCKRNQF